MIAGTERMDAGRRERKAEAPQASLGGSEIVDANDDVIDEAGQSDLPVMQADRNACRKRGGIVSAFVCSSVSQS